MKMPEEMLEVMINYSRKVCAIANKHHLDYAELMEESLAMMARCLVKSEEEKHAQQDI